MSTTARRAGRRRFPFRLIVARGWQSMRRGPFFILGWLFAVPAIALAALMVLSIGLSVVAMVLSGEWARFPSLAGLFLAGLGQVGALAGITVAVLLVNDRCIYLARPSWPRDPRCPVPAPTPRSARGLLNRRQ